MLSRPGLLTMLNRVAGNLWLPVLLMMVLTGCQERQPLKVAYVGGLTGRVAGLGVAQTPALGATLALVGRERVLTRLAAWS